MADPHRAGHELLYYPGEVNLLRANVVVINKVDTATEPDIETVRRNVRQRNPLAKVIEAASRVEVDSPEKIRGARVLVVEDGPTLTHGEMAFGAGVVAARQWGAAEMVDPRPYAIGSLSQVYEKYKHIGRLLPAMGYSPTQLAELEATIHRTPCDAVLVATPIDLGKVVDISQPAVRVRYEIVEQSQLTLAEVLGEFVAHEKRIPVSAGV